MTINKIQQSEQILQVSKNKSNNITDPKTKQQAEKIIEQDKKKLEETRNKTQNVIKKESEKVLQESKSGNLSKEEINSAIKSFSKLKNMVSKEKLPCFEKVLLELKNPT